MFDYLRVFRKSRKYGYREITEYGAPIQIIKVLQNLEEIYSEKDQKFIEENGRKLLY